MPCVLPDTKSHHDFVVAAAGAIAPLVLMLQSSSATVQDRLNALRALRNLTACNENAAAAKAGGVISALHSLERSSHYAESVRLAAGNALQSLMAASGPGSEATATLAAPAMPAPSTPATLFPAAQPEVSFIPASSPSSTPGRPHMYDNPHLRTPAPPHHSRALAQPSVSEVVPSPGIEGLWTVAPVVPRVVPETTVLQQHPVSAEPSQIPIRPYLPFLGRPTRPATPSSSSGAAAASPTSLGSGRDSSVDRTLLPIFHGGFPAASWQLQGPLQLQGLRAASSATAAPVIVPSPFPATAAALSPLVGIHGGGDSAQRTLPHATAAAALVPLVGIYGGCSSAQQAPHATAMALGETGVPHQIGSSNRSGNISGDSEVALGETEAPHQVGSGNGSSGGSGNGSGGGSGGFGHAPTAAVAALLSPAPAAAVSCEAGINTPDENDDEAAGLCSVCMEAPLSILAPCGHLLLCHQCCDDIRSASNMVRLMFTTCSLRHKTVLEIYRVLTLN